MAGRWKDDRLTFVNQIFIDAKQIRIDYDKQK